MKNVPERLQHLADNVFGSKAEMARKLGVSSQTLTPYFAGKTMPGNKIKQRLYEAGININWLERGEGEMLVSGGGVRSTLDDYPVYKAVGAGEVSITPLQIPKEPLLVPLIEVSAGSGVHWDQHTDYYALVGENYHKDMISCRVRGDSMVDIGIRPGDTIIADKTKQPKHGDVVVAVVDGDIILKRLKQNGTQWLLHPENKDYPAVEFDEKTRIIGVFYELRRNRL